MKDKEIYIKVTKNGPYLVYGLKKITIKYIISDENGVAFKYDEGKTFEIKTEPQSLCRCGKSKNAPYCDGTHITFKFDGSLNAPFESILKNAKTYIGPNLILKDNEMYCAGARFCHQNGDIWNFIMENDEHKNQIAVADPSKATGQAVVICPGGAYLGVAYTHEGIQVAQWMNERGITALMLRYRMPNGHHDIPLHDARTAIALLRDHAAEWGIDPHH